MRLSEILREYTFSTVEGPAGVYTTKVKEVPCITSLGVSEEDSIMNACKSVQYFLSRVDSE